MSKTPKHLVEDERFNLEYEIEHLRNLIRIDMRDYQLLCSDDNEGNSYFPRTNELYYNNPIGFINTLEHSYYWYADHLKTEIVNKISKLEKLIIKQNTQENE